jgi:hypothetical protein
MITRSFSILFLILGLCHSASAQKDTTAQRPDVPFEYASRWYVPLLSIINYKSPATGFGYEKREGRKGWGAEAWYLFQPAKAGRQGASNGYRLRGVYRHYTRPPGQYGHYWGLNLSWQQRFSRIDNWYTYGNHTRYITGSNMQNSIRFSVGYGVIRCFKKSQLVSDVSIYLGSRLGFSNTKNSEQINFYYFHEKTWGLGLYGEKFDVWLDATVSYSLGKRILPRGK